MVNLKQKVMSQAIKSKHRTISSFENLKEELATLLLASSNDHINLVEVFCGLGLVSKPTKLGEYLSGMDSMLIN